MFGLNEVGIEQVIRSVLVNYFAKDQSEVGNTVKAMVIRTEDPNKKSIMRIPLILTASVHLWENETSTEGSMTSFFALIVHYLVKVALDNRRITNVKPRRQRGAPTTKYKPFLLSRKKKLENFFDAILSLGKIGYKDLVLENLEQNQNAQKASQLVFDKDDLEDKLGASVLRFALNVGLLSQSSAPGAGDEENVSINFFHKTIEEFLAALYLVCSNKVSFNSFLTDHCFSLESIFELSNILIFSVGLQPTLGSVLSDHIAQIAGSDSDIIEYRQGLYDGCESVEMLFKTLCDCNNEMKYSLTQSGTMTRNNKLRVSDVYLDTDSDDSTIAFGKELISQDHGCIVSLHVEFGYLGIFLFKVVKEFLENTSSLQTLYISNDELVGSYRPESEDMPFVCSERDSVMTIDGREIYIPNYRMISRSNTALESLRRKTESNREDSPTLCSIAPIFSSLTSLSLEGITLTSEAACLLQKAIETNIKIQSLQLKDIYIEQNTSQARDLRRNTSLRTTDNAVATELRLDIKTNERLRNISLESREFVKSSNIQLLDISSCRSLINLTLLHVQVQSVDMFQTAILSFTQLMNLTLENVSFPNDNNSVRLNLTSCTNLKVLHLIRMHVDSIEISPVSLKDLRLSKVSGSLQGLLLVLPDCQHLRFLCIHYLSEEQDVELLTKLSPRLTQVREMYFDVGEKWNTGIPRYHSAKARVVARMVGLDSSEIMHSDMEEELSEDIDIETLP